MTKEMDSKFSNPLPGGLSMFDMDSTSNGLSWAGNIYQKWENICLDNILVQNQCKYVNAVGEHFRKILDEVANDWLNPSDGCVEGPVSDLSLEHNVIAEICERSKVGLDEHHNGNMPVSVELDSFLSSSKDLTPGILINFPRDLNQNEEKQSPTLAEATRSNCSVYSGESCKNVSDSIASLACLTSVPPLLTEVSPPVSHNDEVMEGEQKLSDCTIPTGINGSHASVGCATLLVQNGDENQNEIKTLQASAGLPEAAVTESSDDFDTAAKLNTQGVVDATTDPIEDFEDVKIDDFFHDTGGDELALNSHLAPKSMSYKRKLKHACSPKLPSSYWYGGSNIGMHNKTRIATSPVSREALHLKTVPTNNSCDSDWVLL